MKKYTIPLGWWLVLIILIGAIGWWAYDSQQPGKLDDFARCIADKQIHFYGAFWCPHCQDQKKMFGKSQRLLPYVECATPDGNGETSACQQKNIDAYPTWEFTDGSRQSEVLSLQVLAEKTGCILPIN